MNVATPITTSLIPERHPSYYLMHKYWARKPHNVVRAYIEHFTEPGEIVLDPFAGSGVTFMESILADRRAVAVDINPISGLIIRATMLPCETDEVMLAFEQLQRSVKPVIDEWFTTSCIHCSSPASVAHNVWESVAPCPACGYTLSLGHTERAGRKYKCPNCSTESTILSRDIRDEQLVEVAYDCSCTKSRQVKQATEEDLNTFQKVKSLLFKSALSNSHTFTNYRTLIYEDTRVESFFTPRNERALSLLVEAINGCSSGVRPLLQLAFTSSVAQASRLIAYRNALTTGGPAWTVSGFWIPNIHLELNPWNCFSTRLSKIIRGRKELAKQLASRPYKEANSFEGLQESHNALILTRSCTDLPKHIPDESIGYIFTDPPYGDSVPYLEYSALWFSWLGLDADYDNEIVISNSPDRQKNLQNYQLLLNDAFGECYRVLKPGRWLSLTFHNKKFDVWAAILSSAAQAGFELVNCLYQVPAVIPAKAQLSKAGSVTGDIVLNFRKPQRNESIRTKKPNRDASEIILETAERIIGERGGTATTDELIRGIIIALVRDGSPLLSEHDVSATLLQRFQRTNSYWSFVTSEAHLTKRYEQLSDIAERIIRCCLSDGELEFRPVVAAVLSQLHDDRTLDIKTIAEIYDQVRSSTTARPLQATQLTFDIKHVED